jgi:lipoic acid synthetase
MKGTAPNWVRETVARAKRGLDKKGIEQTRGLLNRLNLATVCESAGCPNRGECFSQRTATFLILGEICTRRCTYCAVNHGRTPQPPDDSEPERLIQAISELGLSHVVITSVTRDDLPDGGADHYARVVAALHRQLPWVRIELLIPDFSGSGQALEKVLTAQPDILAHNMETVPSLYGQVRPGADYVRSLALLRKAKEFSPQVITKSGFMVGLGENDREIEELLNDISVAGCDMLTIGQYLSPSLAHRPVARFLESKAFESWREKALGLGFKSVAAGTLVRSSYKAPLFFRELG